MSPNGPDPDPDPTAQAPPEVPKKQEDWRWLPIIGAIGALVAAWSDLVSNENAAFVCKLGEALNVLFPGFRFGALLAFLVLIALGAALVLVYRPSTRIDAFLRGLAVLAVFNMAVGYKEPGETLENPVTAQIEDMNLNLAGSSGEWVSYQTQLPVVKQGEVHRAAIHIVGFPSEGSAVVTLRAAGSFEILARQKIERSPFQIAKPPQEYIVEVEMEGFRTVRFCLDLRPVEAEYRLRIPGSNVFATLQRLVGPVEVELERIGGFSVWRRS